MVTYTIKDLPWSVNKDDAIKKFRVMEDDLDDFNAVYDEIVPLIHPVLLFGEAAVLANDGHKVKIEDQEFESRILSVNLKDSSTVYPYVVTSGREAYLKAHTYADDLFSYWAHGLCEMALGSFRINSMRMIKERLGKEQLYSMNPGSLQDFPICNQKPLFDLLGNVEAETGVTLTPTFLMVPVKSGSGILFESRKHYQNCMLCPRVDCPNRRAAYEPEKFEKEYGE